MVTTIEVYNIINSDTLRSRKAASNIVDIICNVPLAEDVNIDFENIIFTSRSFCHELLSSIKNRENVRLINANSEIKKMCDVATKKPKIDFGFSKGKIVSLTY